MALIVRCDEAGVKKDGSGRLSDLFSDYFTVNKATGNVFIEGVSPFCGHHDELDDYSYNESTYAEEAAPAKQASAARAAGVRQVQYFLRSTVA